MKDATIGFLVGVIMTVGLMASTITKVEQRDKTAATTSGYLVHDGKAYTVQPTTPATAKD